MKLILCTQCMTVTSLVAQVRSCLCGQSQGCYLDRRNAIYAGPCIPLGLDNTALARALEASQDPNAAPLRVFEGFVIPSSSRYFRRVDDYPVSPVARARAKMAARQARLAGYDHQPPASRLWRQPLAKE